MFLLFPNQSVISLLSSVFLMPDTAAYHFLHLAALVFGKSKSSESAAVRQAGLRRGYKICSEFPLLPLQPPHLPDRLRERYICAVPVLSQALPPSSENAYLSPVFPIVFPGPFRAFFGCVSLSGPLQCIGHTKGGSYEQDNTCKVKKGHC